MEYAVLMAVYEKDNPEWLKESIISMLEQTVLPKQFIIVKDGALTSELDNVIQQFEDWKAPLFTIIALEKNQGLGIALNNGIKHSKYDWIARMDSDDIAMPDRCEKQIKAMNDNHADIVSGTVMEFEADISDASISKSLPRTNEEIVVYARRRNPFNHPCVMFKKSKVEQAGMYRKVHLFEDYDLWVRMIEAGAVGYNIIEPILYMRAGQAMYKRRGGMRYIKSGISFRWYLHQIGFSTFTDFVIAAMGQLIFGLLPNGVRKKGYKVILRK